jgi:(1->4)-alpha-D-glucan 1-alpha-D-glucosylmutase
VVLSEIPHQFADAIARWTAHNEKYKTTVGAQALPDRNTEYFLYQSLIGAWPIDIERIKAYMQKAMREAKQQTSWVNNNKDFENALNSFIDSIFADDDFMQQLESFVSRVLLPGRINSLTQTLLKSTGPGVPDLYQGGELWDLSLVDPDNRRPVDYELRKRLLSELKHMTPQQILERMDDGLPKLHVIHQALLLRRERPEWFGPMGAYKRVLASGHKASHAVAFMRSDAVLVLTQRQIQTIANGWGDTTLTLPEGTWKNRLTGEVVPSGERSIDELLRDFPVALLVHEESFNA